ncbi:FHA domain-containing protein [Kitasatospora sp. NPDC050463]|uniref:FHA domain-containing protein n=1 Tax=Kitasatospora sp. NPDC050463 TaxID=3155786 RepID=UPI0033F18FEF
MSSPSREQALPRLVVDSPERLRGRVFVLADQPMLVGRDSTCQIRVGDPGVSRRHAVVSRSAGHTTVEDLASTNGTRLNGHPVQGQQEVHAGDVLDFGPFEVHYEDPYEAATVPGLGVEGPTAATRTAALPLRPEPPQPDDPRQPREPQRPGQAQGPFVSPAPPVPPSPPEPPRRYSPPHRPAADRPPPDQPPPRPGPPGRPLAPPLGAEPRFDVGQQQAGNLSNVAGNQYNYVQARRESFFREIAATRTRARHLVVTGFLLFVVGGAVYGWAIIDFIAKTNDAVSSERPDLNVPNVLGPEIGGMPVGAIGFAVAAIGSVLIVVGIVLHIVATSRRRRFETEEAQRLQAPPPR